MSGMRGGKGSGHGDSRSRRAAGLSSIVVLMLAACGSGPAVSPGSLSAGSPSRLSPGSASVVAVSIGPSASPTTTALQQASPSAVRTPTSAPLPTSRPTGLVRTNSMLPALSRPVATRLADGRVLLAGGMQGSNADTTALAETYDPTTGKFKQTGSMTQPRAYFAATLLGDGRVLVTGGGIANGFWKVAYWPRSARSSAEAYDPATGKFTAIAPMGEARVGHTSTLLPDGRVLIAGGVGALDEPLASTEIFDPATGQFTPAAPMTVSRSHHTATRLLDGRVLLAGGAKGYNSAELYDPATGTFSPTGHLTEARVYHAATLLADGRVLLTGGPNPSDPSLNDSNSSELFSPPKGAFLRVAGYTDTYRGEGLAVTLLDGRCLIATFNKFDLYDPVKNEYHRGCQFDECPAKDLDTATLLNDGRVLLTSREDGAAYLYWPE